MRVSTIAERVEAVRLRIAAACQRSGRSPDEVTLVAVTKGFPPEAVREAFAAGLSHFGENRVQEAQAKLPLLAGPGAAAHLAHDRPPPDQQGQDGTEPL